ncbi:PASTA domain-containing protein [Thermosipho ferrireducens]|uniref:PASTA domain-containing protein n=1 Tax=Thermosipho ferrireducens TaxID=2571116 RepID=A0ABX7S744_9BACT|nr:PASTA domain-containing protein [Thermosipho ferrireducens]QTA38024.1 PASTA domain-containing protein [Thermosipho ferrireducens]
MIRIVFLFLVGVMFGILAFLGIIYLGEKTGDVFVPDVIGLNIAEAKNKLEMYGFVAEIVGNGKVVNTDPGAGEVVKRGRKIRVFGSSLIERQFKLPDFYGTNAHTVVEILKSWGLNVEIVKIKYPGPDGRVLATYPEKGSVVKTGDSIKLLIDDGDIDSGR